MLVMMRARIVADELIKRALDDNLVSLSWTKIEQVKLDILWIFQKI